ncbi:MAG: PDZ domain-containing protein [Coleofasciculaceae cyanobacterium SM2_1_6]|nr:PDZ domain-containing protein [Coleofasciculaceae cyanobacterium SM2_1_6]
MKNKPQAPNIQLKSDYNSENLPRNFTPSPLRSMQKSVTYVSLILLGAGITLGTGYLTSRTYSLPSPTTAGVVSGSPNRSVNTSPSQPSAVPNGLNFIADVASQVSPAVVKINSSRTVASQGGDSFGDPRLRQFFGLPNPDSGSRVERGSGSGFIVNANGRILTNAHVVDGADKVVVTLNDGRSFEGRVLGSDSVTDLAVVQVDTTNLPTVVMGDSDQLQPGEWAIAIGNPLGLDHTVTKGIISAIGRSSSDIGEGNKRIDFIQTDAAINPGNSGGPLLNAKGEVIGINTAIIRGAQGIGFAIPINSAQVIADQLVQNGKVDHPYLGVQMLDITPEMKQRVNSEPDAPVKLTVDRGVLLMEIVANSPAQKAGLRSGDVITKVNNQTVSNSTEVRRAVEKSKIGTNLTLEIIRGNQTQNVAVQVGTLPKEE